MTLTLPIVIGKKYVRRDGAVITAHRHPNPLFAYVEHESSGFACWLESSRVFDSGIAHRCDLVSDFIEPVGHVHAALMALYAEDAAKCAKPWELWQYKRGNQWEDFSDYGSSWFTDREYRRKPVPTTKTVWVNLYRNGIDDFCGYEHATREEANTLASNTSRDGYCLACVQIEVPV